MRGLRLCIGCALLEKVYIKIAKVEKLEVKMVSTGILIAAAIYVLVLAFKADAMVFISEVFSNPPVNVLDENYEFIELMGTPGMKLDGYAIAVLNGTENELYPEGSIPPIPDPNCEIDEFFSLDGLTLGNNGLLALLMRTPSPYYYPDLNGASRMSDSNWALRSGRWNGGLDDPNNINNDGSTTFVLIRNRPGRTQADPCNPDGLRWGKSIQHDAQLITPIDGQDQWGNGDLDEGGPNGLGGYTLDMAGTSTPTDANDDLEIVDEVSFENGQGWEYDTDDRHVDANSTFGGLPHRHVHALDDPVNFNPDAVTRVDYRTKGTGWTPAGDYGEMANGNNWQDTATEQWIRGRSVSSKGPPKRFYYCIDPNSDPNAVQPYDTHVPHWLDDGNATDFNFSEPNTYEITAGKISFLAVPFIPGDVDRDGICDANDIEKIATVFGEDDWIFANSVPGSTETDSGDPATQIRPWDVDGTGDNGIEASDLQWVLNFQGDTTGRIIGIKYDSYTPSSTGIYLNSNAAVQCTVTKAVNIPSGRSLTTLLVGDVVEITVKGQVTAGANTTSGQENGIMQYIHDVVISTGNVIKVISVEALSPFGKTRASLEELQGTDGDLGVKLVNGYTTSFTTGLTAAANLYRITLQAVGQGSANIEILPAYRFYQYQFAAGDIDGSDNVDFRDFAILASQWLQAPGIPSADIAPPEGDNAVNFLDLNALADGWLEGSSTPRGLKVGHTNNNGNPNSSVYPSTVAVTVVPGI